MGDKIVNFLQFANYRVRWDLDVSSFCRLLQISETTYHSYNGRKRNGKSGPPDEIAQHLKTLMYIQDNNPELFNEIMTKRRAACGVSNGLNRRRESGPQK